METDGNGTSETLQVETTTDAEHVATPSNALNVQTDNPSKGSLVTHSFELKKYRRPRTFKCKLCGDSSKSVKELNAHHHATHDVEFVRNVRRALPHKVHLTNTIMYTENYDLFVTDVERDSHLKVSFPNTK